MNTPLIGKVALCEIEVQHLKIKVGTLEMDLNALGFGSVKIDGKKIPIRGADITIRVGEMPRILLDVVPLPPLGEKVPEPDVPVEVIETELRP